MGIVSRTHDKSPSTLVDRKLPGLALSMNGTAMAPRLRPLLDARGDLTVQLIKHVPGKRAVLAYRFSDGPRAIGKMVRKDRAKKSQRTLTALHTALPARTRTPKVLECWADLGLLLQEYMPGEPLEHWSELPSRPESLDRMARALADLHGLRLDVGSPATLADHIRRTCHPGFDSLRRELPHLGSLLREVESGMYDSEAQRPVQLVPCHGDFGPGQILATSDQLSIVDLDGFAHSDAALDVGNVLVGLQVHAGLDARELTQRFLSTYLAERGLESLPGLPHYQAFGFLRRAMILLRRRPAGWEEQVLHMAGRARQCL